MKSRTSTFAAASIALSALFAFSSEANADSRKGTFYVQGAPAMLTAFAGNDASGVSWHPELHVGVHFNNRHEGGVIAFHQNFYVGDLNGGATQIRGGYDIGIPFDNGMELTLSPHIYLGIGYSFDGGDPLATPGFGFEGRFFPLRDNGFFTYFRPVDIGFWANSDVFFVPITLALGAGYAF